MCHKGHSGENCHSTDSDMLMSTVCVVKYENQIIVS